jgi:hypothetical protein
MQYHRRRLTRHTPTTPDSLRVTGGVGHLLRWPCSTILQHCLRKFASHLTLRPGTQSFPFCRADSSRSSPAAHRLSSPGHNSTVGYLSHGRPRYFARRLLLLSLFVKTYRKSSTGDAASSTVIGLVGAQRTAIV